MSFKRDGDDFSQLNILKKRRVAELFAHHIPDDEALLMSNGRYACTVCHYRPVFDTLQMLTIHRQGKKHQKCMDSHYRKEQEYMVVVEKRQHEHYVRKEQNGSNYQEEDSLPLLTKTREKTQNVLLKTTPYNSCVKWGRTANLDSNVRQQTATTGSFFASTRTEHLKAMIKAESDDIPTSPRLQEMSSLVPQLPSVEHPREFKHHPTKVPGLGRIESAASMELIPYISKTKRKTSLVDSLEKYSTSNMCVPVRELEINSSYQQGIGIHHLNYPATIPNDSKMPEFNSQLPVSTNFKHIDTSERYIISTLNDSESKGELNSGVVQKAGRYSLKSKSAPKKQVAIPITGMKDKKKEIEQILQLTSSGWKRDRGGMWVKDEDVEFDSDEEEPPAT